MAEQMQNVINELQGALEAQRVLFEQRFNEQQVSIAQQVGVEQERLLKAHADEIQRIEALRAQDL